MPSAGAGTTKKDQLNLLVGAVYRMVQGCYTPMELVLSVVKEAVDFVVSTRSSSVSLVRVALFKVSKATENDTSASAQLLSETLMGLC